MYINTETNQYPVSESEIRALFPNTSFPVPFVPPSNYAHVFQAPQPTFNALTEFVREIAPTLTQLGTYQQAWEVVALPPEQAQANQAAALEVLQSSIVQATQDKLDNFAQTRNYDGILSAATYATSTIPKFQAEGQYAVFARDLTWAKLYEILAEVEAGTRPVPTGFVDIEPSLPTLNWPSN